MATGIGEGIIMSGLRAVVGSLSRVAFSALRRARPLAVSVEPVVGDEWSVVFSGQLPSDALALEGTSESRKVYERLRELGAADYRETRLRLTVRGAADTTVVVRGIRPLVQQSLPLGGTLVHCPTAGANAATLLVFDLDDPDAVAWEFTEDGLRERVGSRPFFDNHNVTLAPGEVHDFVIVGKAASAYVEWSLEVNLEIEGKPQCWEITYNDRTFKTSGDPAGGFLESLEWAWYEGGRFVASDPNDHMREMS